jgi:hypothetical protein
MLNQGIGRVEALTLAPVRCAHRSNRLRIRGVNLKRQPLFGSSRKASETVNPVVSRTAAARTFTFSSIRARTTALAGMV